MDPKFPYDHHFSSKETHPIQPADLDFIDRLASYAAFWWIHNRGTGDFDTLVKEHRDRLIRIVMEGR